MLPYFFRHYDDLVDRYVFFDDGSTDSTPAIIKNHPKTELRSLPRLDVDSYVLAAQKVYNNCWKESRGKADWVIITDVDEHLYHKDLPGYLSRCQREGITLIPGIGYQMLSDEVPHSPKKMTELVTRGTHWCHMNKLNLFNPDKIIENNGEVGNHVASPTGEVVYPAQDELLNLHYKYLSLERTFQRHVELQEKLGSLDKKNLWGDQYSWTKAELEKNWEMFKAKSIENVMLSDNAQRIEFWGAQKLWWR